ncbi:uncharacterized protein LOC131607320 isoform X2 [Vicia villosa]|uniref:uncharacterized protein LOC131607320 isoform X2 n=1 Tax=Vicia villosa TaxID=3911 RepID=UPI00273C6211|nr:uncharacterized protein LOC131607320 isoform X2 [Vicia villosa]
MVMQSDGVLDIAAWEVMEEKKSTKLMMLMMDYGDSSVTIVADQEVEKIIKTSENHESVELEASPAQICDNVLLRKLFVKKGVKSLLAVPISFVSEHIETLEEIDVEYKELALESG